MEIWITPTDAQSDEQQSDIEQVAIGYSADDEPFVPSDDGTEWWLPDEADMMGPNSVWRNCGGQWTPPEE